MTALTGTDDSSRTYSEWLKGRRASRNTLLLLKKNKSVASIASKAHQPNQVTVRLMYRGDFTARGVAKLKNFRVQLAALGANWGPEQSIIRLKAGS
jgi:hypothetical protein